MNETKLFEKNNLWSSKINLMFYSTLMQQANIKDDPITQLISIFPEIKLLNENTSIKDQDIIKILYFNSCKIEKILYENDELIEIKPNNILINLSYYFYLDLLIKHNENIENYIYTIDLIKAIDEQQKNIDQKEIFKKLLISKIIIELIDNYKGCMNYNEDKDDKILQMIEEDNKIIIKDNIHAFTDLNINWTSDSFINKKNKDYIEIQQIYIEIIISLINNNFNDEHIVKKEIIDQIEIEGIDLTKTMLDELSKELNNNNNYNINSFDDLFNDQNILFFYELFKYILKKPLYVFQIEFLEKTRKKIIKIIKKDINQFLESFHKKSENMKEKIKFILKFFDEPNFYLKKYINNIKEEIETKIQDIQPIINPLNDKENSNYDNNINYGYSSETKDSKDYNYSNPFSKPSANQSSSHRKINNLEELSKNEEKEIEEIKEIMEYSLFKFYTDEDKNIVYYEIIFGKDSKTIDFDEMKQKRINLNEAIYVNYQKFLNFISWFEDTIKNKFINNYKLEGELEFKRDNSNDNNSKLEDLDCTYYFKRPDDGRIQNYIDEKCLFHYEKDTSLLEGFNNFLDEINQEDYKEILYLK